MVTMLSFGSWNRGNNVEPERVPSPLGRGKKRPRYVEERGNNGDIRLATRALFSSRTPLSSSRWLEA